MQIKLKTLINNHSSVHYRQSEFTLIGEKKNNKLFYKLNENDDEKTIGLDFLDFLFLY